MSDTVKYLEHVGIVTDAQNGRVKISLTGSGCSACHKSLCMLGESKAKEVDIPVKRNYFKSGDEVIVKINPSSGYTAVILLYLVPFVLMILSLSLTLHWGYSEGIGGLTSLLILVPYFYFLFLQKNKLRSHCTIELEKR